MAGVEGLELLHLVAVERGEVKEVTLDPDMVGEIDAILQEGEIHQDVQEVGDLLQDLQETSREGDTDLHQDVQEMSREGDTDEGHRAVGIGDIIEEKELEIQVVKNK